MSTRIYVVCRSAAPITYAELETVMAHMGWLDQPATFDPPLGKVNGADPHWRTFDVSWDPKVRPVSVVHVFERDLLAAERAIIRQLLDDAELDVTPELDALLDAAAHIFVFELEGDPRQDVWDMIDAVEAYLAREHDGVIIAREGVFDGMMQRIA